MLRMLLKSMIMKFTKYGRYLDLVAGVGLLALAWYWQSWVTAGFGVFSLAMFAINLNGIIQKRTMSMAVGVHARRQASRPAK